MALLGARISFSETQMAMCKPVRCLVEAPILGNRNIDIIIMIVSIIIIIIIVIHIYPHQGHYFQCHFPKKSPALAMLQPSLASCGWYSAAVGSFGQPKCARQALRSRNQRRVRLRAWLRDDEWSWIDKLERTTGCTTCLVHIYVLYLCMYINVKNIYLYVCI